MPSQLPPSPSSASSGLFPWVTLFEGFGVGWDEVRSGRMGELVKRRDSSASRLGRWQATVCEVNVFHSNCSIFRPQDSNAQSRESLTTYCQVRAL